MSIATKKGDTGTTSLFTGEKVLKSNLRVEAYGTGDELISFLALLKTYTSDFGGDLEKIQNKIYKINSYLASTSNQERFLITDDEIQYIEQFLGNLEEEFGTLTHFIVPSECRASAVADICRTVCRRFERRVVDIAQHEMVDKNILKFINRLSDLLFMLARVIGKREGGRAHGFEG